MQLIETITVGAGGAATIEFQNIPQDADDLVFMTSTRSNTSGEFTVLYRFNNDTANNYAMILARVTSGSWGESDSLAIDRGIYYANPSNYYAGVFGNAKTYVSGYSGSGIKSAQTHSNSEQWAGTNDMGWAGHTWNNSNGITTLTLSMFTGNFVEHSTASLYKITHA